LLIEPSTKKELLITDTIKETDQAPLLIKLPVIKPQTEIPVIELFLK
jgi:hypothetical protein